MENRSSNAGKNNRKQTRADRLRARRPQNDPAPSANPNPVVPTRPINNGAQSYPAPNGFVRRPHQSPPFIPAHKRFSLPFNLDDLHLPAGRLLRLALFSVLPLTILLVLLLIFMPRNHTRHVAGAARPTPTVDPLQQALKMAGANHASGRTNILLMGSDQREGDPGFRTDTIILLSIDADTNKIGVVSFPRDLYLEVPGLGSLKINQIMGLGKFEAMQAVFAQNWGIQIDHYVMTNFDGFVEIVNSLGGLEVEVDQTLTDDCDLPQAVDGDCTVNPGPVQMDGLTALWYIRSRQTSSDYDRLRRAQEVGWAAFKKLITLNGITRLPELYNTYSKSMQTDLRPSDLIPLLPQAARVFKDKSLMTQAVINETEATPSWAWDGMWILLPDNQAIKKVMADAGVQ